MTYDEFKALLPLSRVTEAEFGFLAMQAKAVIDGLIVYCHHELNKVQKAAYNRALALQIESFYSVGVAGDGLTAQTINGTGMTFGNAPKAGEININNVSRAILGNAGLFARSGFGMCRSRRRAEELEMEFEELLAEIKRLDAALAALTADNAALWVKINSQDNDIRTLAARVTALEA